MYHLLKVKSDTPYSAPRVYEEIAILILCLLWISMACWHLVSCGSKDLGNWESMRPIFDGVLELYNGSLANSATLDLILVRLLLVATLSYNVKIARADQPR